MPNVLKGGRSSQLIGHVPRLVVGDFTIFKAYRYLIGFSNTKPILTSVNVATIMISEDGLPNISNVEHIAYRILPYVHNTDDMRFFTDHAHFHCIRVLKYVDMIIDICDCSGTSLNEAEQLVLRCSCWLHDLGCIRERENHAKESIVILQKLSDKGLLNLGVIKSEIEYVICAHSSKGLSLDKVPVNRNITGFDYPVRLRLLCALFKLADECDIDRQRAPKVIFDILEDKMTDESKWWWRGHSNVIGVYFSEGDKISIVLQKGTNSKIANSLMKTMVELAPIFKEYRFPYTDCKIILQESINVDY